MKLLFAVLAVNILYLSTADSAGCSPRHYNYSSFVCVCDDNQCDTVEPIPSLSRDQFAVYTTSKSSARLSLSIGNFTRDSKITFNSCSRHLWSSTVCVDSSKVYQTIIGFGGSFTDSAGINIYSLSKKLQNQLLKSYYSTEGLNFTMGRVPIGGCDFSTRPYTYNDNDNEEDFNLTNFKLQPEDFNYKMPLIKEAVVIRGFHLQLVASPWSAPAWMKNSNAIDGFGMLKGDVGGEYYEAWANYFVKFLEEYRQHGIDFWGITAQNEPIDGFIPFFPFNAMGFLPGMQATFVNKNLGPAMDTSGFGNVSIFVLDDNRPLLIPWMKEIMKDPLSEKYVKGVALHWYLDKFTPASVIESTHNSYPNQIILMSEVSFLHTDPSEPAVKLGDWARGEAYAEYLIENFNHWVMGWIDWNLAVDPFGGPNWAKFNLEGTIIVNTSSNEFYKQPQYYAIGHFSKFVPPGSKRIHSELSWGNKLFNQLSAISFQTPDNIIVILQNRKSNDVVTDVVISGFGTIKSAKIPQDSIQTYIINR
ncbi:hypothetical protein CHUAL_005385 [Chamberlinius hualienensis]